MAVNLEAEQLFFTADLSGNTKKTGLITIKFRTFLEDAFAMLESDGGFRVHCPLKESNWGTAVEDPVVACMEDFAAIERSIGVIAMVGKKESPPIYTELGWGIACNKAAILACGEQVRIDEMHPAIADIKQCVRVSARNSEDLASNIMEQINNWEFPLV